MRRVLPALIVLCLVLVVCIDALAALPGALGAVVQPGGPLVVVCGQVGDPDLDCDGYPVSQDCDDKNPLIHPNQSDYCDGIDNNCNGLVDGPDMDLDGSHAACDCDDNDAIRGVGPRFWERCDNVDNDCDGLVDDGADCDTDWSAEDTSADSAATVDTDANGDSDAGGDTDSDAGGDSDVPSLDCRDPGLTAEERLECAEAKAEAAGLCSTGGGTGSSVVVMIGIMLLGIRRRS